MVTPAGYTIPVLSSQCEENRLADERAFTALMRAVREKDAGDKTIIAVQAEGKRKPYLAGGPFRVIFKRKPAPDAELTPAMAAELLSDGLPDLHMVEEGTLD